jgi:hypothetical protein
VGKLPRSPGSETRGQGPRSGGDWHPVQVSLDAVFVEVVEPVSGGDGVAQAPAVVDVGVHVVQGNDRRGFAGPGEEEFQVVEVMDRDGGAVAWV